MSQKFRVRLQVTTVQQKVLTVFDHQELKRFKIVPEQAHVEEFV